MTVAATMLLVAAAGRMSFLPAPPPGLAAMFLVWSSPVLLAVVDDGATIAACTPCTLPVLWRLHFASGASRSR